MNNKLELIAKSYDTAIELGRQGLPDPYFSFSEEIKSDPNYKKYKSCKKNNEGSERKQIKNFLRPNKSMKFID